MNCCFHCSQSLVTVVMSSGHRLGNRSFLPVHQASSELEIISFDFRLNFVNIYVEYSIVCPDLLGCQAIQIHC